MLYFFKENRPVVRYLKTGISDTGPSHSYYRDDSSVSGVRTLVILLRLDLDDMDTEALLVCGINLV